ncbi:hypothetical protein RDV84_23275 [Lysobacter yananisis]|uniref:DUF551 domain-containing protein n=1 Tax=Lysobacter yananisis TaxID=1003114 RepID=A0ABY9P7E0_9GAMM|nr:hypothetical protein [Lysobacter yananisis]WMT02849.1 hypothetical protein RDV84_23275 [Lysobacter yananisis]
MNSESLRGLVEGMRESANAARSAGHDLAYSYMREQVKKFESLLNQAPAVGQAAEGWVVVPREPTEEMKVSALHRLNPLGALVDWSHDSDEGATRPDVTECWTAMLSAAPAAPVAAVYAVPTGDTSESGDETYTLHDAPVPMADNVRVAAAPAVEVDEARDEAIDSILWELESWGKAYPIDMFPEPDPNDLKWLHATKQGLCGQISASMGRHISGLIAKDLAALAAALGREVGRG